MSTLKYKRIERPFQVKAGSVKSDGTFEGYGSIFGELDSYRDIMMPGAFKRTLKEDFEAKDRPVPMLWQHNSDAVIGVYPDIKEDDKGLWLRGQCNLDVGQGREAHSLLKQGAISGLSIGYTTVLSEWDEKALTRKLLEVNLWEVSLVTFPAGDSARVSSVKSIEGFTTLSDIEDHLRDVGGFSRKETLAIVSRIKAIAPQSDSADGEAAQLHRVKAILRNL